MFARPAEARPRPDAIALWLMVVAALVFFMVVVGGITRLTESGLSITRWEPISGAIPPLGAEAWQAQFDLYKASPQYELQGHGMTLADFKAIFFWEYVHRLLGRLIGLAFALPLAWFAWRRAIPPGFGWKLGALLGLGALQGAIGWWMVASGLVDRPEVSHIRLAVHLLTALLIFAGLIWVALDLKAMARPPLLAIWALCLLFLQYLFGAYVAGLDAGYAFNSWPKMGEDWYPAGAEWLEPALRNFADNPIMVQFVHRWLAFPVAALAIWLGLAAWLRGLRMEAGALIGAVCAQVLLGILTILSGVRIEIAVAHQGMAVLLLAATVTAAHRLGEGEARKALPLDGGDGQVRIAPRSEAMPGGHGDLSILPIKGRGQVPDVTQIVSVYAVFADDEEARRIAGIVVEEQLAACANILAPCHSIYRWQGRIEQAAEVPAIFKTTAEAAPRLVARIAGLHSYDIPALVVWPIAEAIAAYAAWVEAETDR